MKVVVIKYNAGNIFSVVYALKRLGVEAEVTGDHNLIQQADKVIFPGVGEAGTTMAYLRLHGLDKVICSLQQPVLGICIGMQLMCSHSEEGNTACLGIFSEKVSKFRPCGNTHKVPHMGWNLLENVSSPLFKGIESLPYLYYVHSFAPELGPHTTAITQYIKPFSAVLQRNNYYAVQFHPEKSGETGARILSNFLAL